MKSIFTFFVVLGKRFIKQTLHILFFLVECIRTVSSFQCYYCNSGVPAGCNDPFKSSDMSEENIWTAEDNQVCIVSNATNIVDFMPTTFESLFFQKVKDKINGVVTVGRTPGDPEYCRGTTNGCTTETSGPQTSTICCCNTNLCNGASTACEQSFFMFPILSTLVILVMRS